MSLFANNTVEKEQEEKKSKMKKRAKGKIGQKGDFTDGGHIEK